MDGTLPPDRVPGRAAANPAADPTADPGAAALDAADDAAITRAYLSTRDAACPECSYNLRGSDGSACPECGRAVRLGVGRPAEPRSWLVGLIFLCMGGGFATILSSYNVIYISQSGSLSWTDGLREPAASIPLVAFVLYLPVLWVWLRARRRLTEARSRQRRLAAFGAAATTCVPAAIFVPLVML